MKTFFTEVVVGFFLVMLAVSSAAIFPNEPSSSLLVGDIKINSRQLLLVGTPFIMKGICYNPVRKGEGYPGGLMIVHPTAEDLRTIEKDFQMMVAAGINTIRTYQPITDSSILTLLSTYQLRTVVPICTSYNSSLDTNSIVSNIELLKNEPSTLIWEIGNEWNLNHFYTHNIANPSLYNPADLSNEQCLDLIENITNLIRAHDTAHPVSTDVIYAPKISYSNYPSCVDLYGVNVYHELDFGSNFNQWDKLIGDKPIYIGECGADAWNQNINQYDEISQDVALGHLINLMWQNLSAKDPKHILIGGCVFEWCDEWWKEGNPDQHDTTGFLKVGSGPYPDSYFNNEWFGIVDIDRNPRFSYFTMQQLFTEDAK